LQIIILFGCAIAFTFITDYLQAVGFFADTLAVKDEWSWVDENHNWETRHYIWWWMGVCLFILGAVRTICFIGEEGENIFN
jgi:hypothetical protein